MQVIGNKISYFTGLWKTNWKGILTWIDGSGVTRVAKSCFRGFECHPQPKQHSWSTTLIIFTLGLPRLEPGPALNQSINFQPIHINFRVALLSVSANPLQDRRLMEIDCPASVQLEGQFAAIMLPSGRLKSFLIFADLIRSESCNDRHSGKKLMSWLKTEGQDNGLTWEIPKNMETLPSAQNRT